MGTGQMASHKHLFVGREDCTTLITQFQLFVVASVDRFLGNIKRCGKGIFQQSSTGAATA